MRYSDRLEATKYLFTRCHRHAIDDDMTMLHMIEDAYLAGSGRGGGQKGFHGFLVDVISGKRSMEVNRKFKLKKREERRLKRLSIYVEDE